MSKHEWAQSMQPMEDPYKRDDVAHLPPLTIDMDPLVGVVQPPEPMVLDPRFAFERALITMVEVSRRKRADYATDDDEFRIATPNAYFVALLSIGARPGEIDDLR